MAVELVAVRMGFHEGARIRVGERFTFDGETLPKWARLPAEAAVELSKAPAQLGDTKPVKARAAAKAKAVAE